MQPKRLFLAALALALVTALAAPAAAQEASLATQFVFGPHPWGSHQVAAECHGETTIDPLTLERATAYACTPRADLFAFITLFASTCSDLNDPTTCSQFTGTLRVTIRDEGTQTDVYEADFAGGAVSPYTYLVSGDGVIYGALDVAVEAVALDPGYVAWGVDTPADVGPAGGAWHVWVTS